MPKFIDLTNLRFGKLTVLSQSENRGKLVQWRCLCDCGKETEATTKKLRDGRKRSCGCLWLPAVTGAKTKHGHASGGKISDELRCWMGMRSRCNSPSNPAYLNYGARGITVCERWNEFANFLEDMGEKPTALHSIERIDNNGAYEPGNCKWAIDAEQCRNRRSNVFVKYLGNEMCLADAAKLSGLNSGTIRFRIKLGWPENKLFDPIYTSYTKK